ncbi:hypothetical protein C0J52_05222 [Blattella germanica]|nr:hypothetical protein C0J52_05222 [Blattella germanica]
MEQSFKRMYITAGKQKYINNTYCLQMTLSNTKGLVWDIPYFMPPWNNIMEFDLIFKLTNVTKFFLSKKKFKLMFIYLQPVTLIILAGSKHNHLEILRILDFDGRACMFKTLCEARDVLRPGMSLVEDFMHVLFT